MYVAYYRCMCMSVNVSIVLYLSFGMFGVLGTCYMIFLKVSH